MRQVIEIRMYIENRYQYFDTRTTALRLVVSEIIFSILIENFARVMTFIVIYAVTVLVSHFR